MHCHLCLRYVCNSIVLTTVFQYCIICYYSSVLLVSTVLSVISVLLVSTVLSVITVVYYCITVVYY